MASKQAELTKCINPRRKDGQEPWFPCYSPGKYSPERFGNLPTVTQKSPSQYEKPVFLVGLGCVGRPCLPWAVPHPSPIDYHLLPAYRRCLPCPDSDELPQVLTVRLAPPLGPWLPVPLKDFAPVIILSSPASSTFPSFPDLSHQHTNKP